MRVRERGDGEGEDERVSEGEEEEEREREASFARVEPEISQPLGHLCNTCERDMIRGNWKPLSRSRGSSSSSYYLPICAGTHMPVRGFHAGK